MPQTSSEPDGVSAKCAQGQQTSGPSCKSPSQSLFVVDSLMTHLESGFNMPLSPECEHVSELVRVCVGACMLSTRVICERRDYEIVSLKPVSWRQRLPRIFRGHRVGLASPHPFGGLGPSVKLCRGRLSGPSAGSPPGGLADPWHQPLGALTLLVSWVGQHPRDSAPPVTTQQLAVARGRWPSSRHSEPKVLLMGAFHVVVARGR
ncbi:hypothetical protein CB1_000713008 [Camelus ferus]|nr:hypothetical protein CB1_000713008 [Camelus ferus]